MRRTAADARRALTYTQVLAQALAERAADVDRAMRNARRGPPAANPDPARTSGGQPGDPTAAQALTDDPVEADIAAWWQQLDTVWRAVTDLAWIAQGYVHANWPTPCWTAGCVRPAVHGRGGLCAGCAQARVRANRANGETDDGNIQAA